MEEIIYFRNNYPLLTEKLNNNDKIANFIINFDDNSLKLFEDTLRMYYIEKDICFSDKFNTLVSFKNAQFDKEILYLFENLITYEDFIKERGLLKNPNITNIAFKYYDGIDDNAKKYLLDLVALTSINKTLTAPSLELQDRLLSIINNVYTINCMSENYSISYITDKILNAYINNEISLTSLEEMDDDSILMCIIGEKSFSEFEETENLLLSEEI